MDKTLSSKESSIIFWASFLALMTCGVAFGIRVMSIGIWAEEFAISGDAAGALFGSSLWPIAISMILFSLVVDKIGYKSSMMVAFASMAGSSIWTLFAQSLDQLTLAFVIFGFGHGIVEAVINPLCATMYKSQKSKMLNILHASWPAGVAVGALVFLALGSGENPLLDNWRQMFWFVLIPAILFGLGFIVCHNYPEDERVENNVSYTDMLREFGGLGIFLAATFLFYKFAEVGGYLGDGYARINTSLAVGAVAGLVSGFVLKSAGKILFFIICLIMIPLATAELATDGWIQVLMKPVMKSEFNLDSGYAIVLSSLIMMTFRFFAGIPLKFMTAPTLLLVSSVFSIAGLFLLSGASGFYIILAFTLYAIGQTFYMPTILGFTAEQFPKGGAMTLNTVAAIGLLTVGIFGIPFLGAVKTNFDAQALEKEAPALYNKVETVKNEKTGEQVEQFAYKEDKNFFGWDHKSLKTEAALADKSLTSAESTELKKTLDKSARKTIRVAAALPALMAITFLLIILWYKSKGGYKPIVLSEEHVDENKVASF